MLNLFTTAFCIIPKLVWLYCWPFPEAINCLNQAIDIYTDMVRAQLTPLYQSVYSPVHSFINVHWCDYRAGLPSQPSTTSPSQRFTSPSWWTSRRWGVTVFKYSMWERLLFYAECWIWMSFALRPLPTTSKQPTITRERNPTGKQRKKKHLERMVIHMGNAVAQWWSEESVLFLSVLQTSVCWRWATTALSWSSTRKPLRSMSRYDSTFRPHKGPPSICWTIVCLAI